MNVLLKILHRMHKAMSVDVQIHSELIVNSQGKVFVCFIELFDGGGIAKLW